MTLVLALACREAHGPFREPLLADWTPHREACDDLRVVGRIRVGGTHLAVASTARGDVAVAAGDGLVVLDRTDLHVLAEHVLPGEALDADGAADGTVWVAAGTAGIVRVRDPYAPGAFDVWPTGGVVSRVVAEAGSVWAVDRTGRVLHLRADATADATPEALVVDGRPGSITVEDGQAVVALGGAGATRVRRTAAGLVAEPSVRAGVVTDRVGAGFSATGPIVRRGDAEVQLADQVLDLEGGRDGAYVAARKAGVVFWDGRTAPVTWDPGPAARPAFHPVAVGVVRGGAPGGADRVAVAGGNGGTALADGLGAQGIRAFAVSEPGGFVEALLPIPGGLAVAVSTFNDTGRIEVLARAAGGAYAVADRVDAEGRPRGLARDGDRLLVARDGPGAGILDLALPPGRRSVTSVGDVPRSTAAFVPAGNGEWLVVGRERDALWLDAATGTVSARVHDPTGRQLAAAGSLAGRAWLLEVHQGRVRLVDRAGAGTTWLLAGASNDPVEVVAPAVIGGALLVPVPELGVQLVDPDRGLLDVLRLPTCAWAVTAWGDGVAIAAGTGGVVLARRTGDHLVVVGRCDLPGDTRALAADGDRLVVGTGGLLVELVRP